MIRFRNDMTAIAALCAASLLSALPAEAAQGWHALMNMSTAVNEPAAGEINGTIYIVGGVTGGGPTATVQAFNPHKNTWATLASLPETLYQGDGTGTINSILYVAGGWNGDLPTNTLYAYDPVANSWAAKATLSHLSACGQSAVINSKLYVTTPCNGNSGYFNLLDVYDPATNAWTSLHASTYSHAAGAGAAINGKFYVAGGYNGTVIGNTEVYDPATNKWTQLASMPTPVQAASSVALDGQLWVFGGQGNTVTGAKTPGTDTTVVQVYDPLKNKWTASVFPVPSSTTGSAAAETDGLAFVAGGSGPVATTQYLQVLPFIP